VRKIYVVSVSGGKDSQATLKWMVENYGSRPGVEIRAVMADTQWEHPDVYSHIKYIEGRYGVDIEILETEGFEALALRKKMMPSRIKKFCTEFLKIRPLNAYFRKFIVDNPDARIVSVTGVRAGESQDRAKEAKWKTTFMFEGKPSKKHMMRQNSITVFQPIVYWSEADVYEYLREDEMCALYYRGSSRVGCYPCINSNKTERGMLEPWALDKVVNLEKKVSEAAGAWRGFWWINKKPMDTEMLRRKEQPYNALGFDIGCVNPYGRCGT